MLNYTDDYLYDIFENVKCIAMVGASPNWVRPSHFAMKYLQSKGFRVRPVNPLVTGKSILGELVYPDLNSVPGEFQMVDIFRTSSDAGKIIDDAVKLKTSKGIKVVWMQLGVINKDAQKLAKKAGLKVVMDRCPKIEIGRLYGELSWSGVNSKIITAKRPRGMRLIQK